jgi:hypothetical protein
MIFLAVTLFALVEGRSHHNHYTSASTPLPRHASAWHPEAFNSTDHYVLYMPSSPTVTMKQVKDWLNTDDVHYVPHHTFIVHASAQAILNSIPSILITAMHPLLPHHKANLKTSEAKPSCNKIDILISRLPDDVTNDFKVFANNITTKLDHRLGIRLRNVELHPKRMKIRLTLDHPRMCGNAIQFLTGLSRVRWVEPVPTFKSQNNIATWTLQSSEPQQRPIWARNISGTGILLAIGDTGLDYDSCFFRDPNQNVAYFPRTNPNHRKVFSYVECVDDDGNHEHQDGNGAHGTHVSGSAAGKALADTGDMSKYNGMAPDAKIIFHDLTCGGDQSLYLPSDMGDYYDPGHKLGAKICSNSWGSDDSPTTYSATDRETDIFAYHNQDYLAIFAAGNSASAGILSPAASKNVLTVGAHYNSDDSATRDNLAGFSALGPTYDNRLKPEIVGPGQPVNSAHSDGVLESNQCDLEEKGGTSMATPHISGSAVLIRQYFVDGWYPLGRRMNTPLFPSGSLIKAFIIQGAQAMLGTQSGQSLGGTPSRYQGWGRLVLTDLLYFADKGNTNHLHVLNNLTIAQHEVQKVCVSVNQYSPSAVSSLRVTLAWLDPAIAAEGSPSSVINDLDVVIVDSLGQMYFANSRGELDNQNIVEQITIGRVQSGIYRVYIYGSFVPENGEYGGQPFSAVISAPGIEIKSTCEGACPAGCSGHGTCQQGTCICDTHYHHVDCSKCNSVTVCNGNGECNDRTRACTCGANFLGSACQTCKPGWYGPKCDGDCKCGDKGTCNFDSGICKCVTNYGGAHCERCAFDHRGDGCTVASSWCLNRQVRVLTDTSRGYLQINDDGKYANSQTCSWSIVAKHPSWKIKLEFVSFVVEETYDYVQIYDGPDVTSRSIKKLTGHLQDIQPIISSSNSMFVKFESDLFGTDVGFVISYTVLSSCSDLTTCNARGKCSTNDLCICDGNYDPQTFCKTLKATPAPITLAPPTQSLAPGTTSAPVPATPVPPPTVVQSCIANGVECSNHGACSTNAQVCICDVLYTGDHCEYACPALTLGDVTLPCSGHGKCAKGTCECTAPYSGRFCQIDISNIIVLNGYLDSRHRMTVEEKSWQVVRVLAASSSSRLRFEVSLVGASDSELALSLWLGAENIFYMPKAEWNVDTPVKTAGRYCLEFSGLQPAVEYYIGVYAKTPSCDVIIEIIETMDVIPQLVFTKEECVPHKVVGDYPVDTFPLTPLGSGRTSPPSKSDDNSDTLQKGDILQIIYIAIATAMTVSVSIGIAWLLRFTIQRIRTPRVIATITASEMAERIP